MKRKGNVILGCAMICGIVTLLSEANILPDTVGRIFGPAVLALLFVWVMLTRSADRPGHKVLMLVALALSCMADIVLNINFVYGLGIFLLMHIVYIVIYSRRGGWSWGMLSFAVFYLVVVGLVVGQIWPTVSADELLRVGVPIYIVAVTLMAVLAASAWYRYDTKLLAYAALGSLSFFVSDACIAIDEFAYPHELSGLWILPTYWLAQYLIASALPPKVE